jgi:hypothetical protein
MPTPAFGACTGYEDDGLLWATEQLALLRAKKFAQLDLEGLITELEFAVADKKSALRNRLRVLTAHLLKCQFQPTKKTKSWLRTIHEQRAHIETLFMDSPSLKNFAEEYANWAYPRTVRKAALETGLPVSAFPEQSPFTMEQLLDLEFLPEA